MSRGSSRHIGNSGEAFICAYCRHTVLQVAEGTGNRNHCPHCLWSIHLDTRSGDRNSLCQGLMEPILIWKKKSGECSIIHQCTRCGMLRANRIAGDDDEAALDRIIETSRAPSFVRKAEIRR